MSSIRLRSLSPALEVDASSSIPAPTADGNAAAASTLSSVSSGVNLHRESDAKIMERAQSFTEVAQDDEMSLEERLLEKLDYFLCKLERKFNSFENYFNGDKDLADDEQFNQGKKLIDEEHTNFYRVLKSLRERGSSKSTLDKISKILDESYGNLFNKAFHHRSASSSSMIMDEEHVAEIEGFINEQLTEQKKDDDKSAMYQRLLTGLHFLDEKIDQVEKALNIPTHNEVYQLKDYLYNYEKALLNGSKRLLHFYELPFQWRENKYIMFGHRFNQKHISVVKSICQCHNETTNIWTHLLGTFYLLYLALYQFPNSDIYPYTNAEDLIVFGIFFAAALNCLIFSVLWHTWCNIAHLPLRSRFACIDYTGITVLITASIITTEHLALRDHKILELGYMAFSLLAGVAGVVFTWSEYFDKPECRSIRILFFISLASLGVAAFASVCLTKGVSYALSIYAPLLKSFAFYLSGVVFYGLLIPERWRTDVIVDEFDITDDLIMRLDSKGCLESYLSKQPEMTEHAHKFFSLWWVDYFLNSHNIWHVFVIGGILGHYSAIVDMFKATVMN